MFIHKNILQTLFFFTALVITAYGYPAPSSYTSKSPINMTIDLPYVSPIQFSPDMSTIAYGIWGIKYRESIWSNSQLQIQQTEYPPKYTFDHKGQNLFMFNLQRLQNGSKKLKFYSYSVKNSTVNTTRIQHWTYTKDDFDSTSNDQIKVSPLGPIAIFIDDTLFVFANVSQNKYTLYDQQDLKDLYSVFDMQWHPTQRETLFIATPKGLYSYQMNSKSFGQIYTDPSYQIVILSGGSVIVSGHSNTLISYLKVSTYINRIVTYCFGFNDKSIIRTWKSLDDKSFMTYDKTNFYIEKLFANNTSRNRIKNIIQFFPQKTLPNDQQQQDLHQTQFQSLSPSDFAVVFNLSKDQYNIVGFSPSFNDVYFTSQNDNNTRVSSLIRRWGRCGDDAYLSNQQCYSCPSKCKTCVSSSVCTSCNNSLFLFKGDCLNCSVLIANCDTCSQAQNSTFKCDKCLNNLKYNLTTKECGCQSGYVINANITCVKCSSLIENCDNCSIETSSLVKCEKCLNNLRFNETLRKCICEDGYKLNTNKTCEKIPDPDPIPPTPDNGNYIKLRNWQIWLGVSILVTLNVLICAGVFHCMKKRMMRRRIDSSLLGSEQDTIQDPYKPVNNSYGNTYAPYQSYGSYDSSGQYKNGVEKRYFQEKRTQDNSNFNK